MSRALPVLALAFTFTGCQAFLIDPQDSSTLRVAKFSARVPLALVSFGISEGFYYCARSTRSTLPSWSNAQWELLTPQERALQCESAFSEALSSEPNSYQPAYTPPEPKKRNKYKRAYRKALKQHKKAEKMHRHTNAHHRHHKSMPKHYK